MDDWGSHVDRLIREAQERGEFDNLPGTGKPLQLDDLLFTGQPDVCGRKLVCQHTHIDQRVPAPRHTHLVPEHAFHAESALLVGADRARVVLQHA
ncbi:MAG: DUF1992 domain-containing protein [Chloroflexi bacterium]|nr:DUF1992 domain-containing protein [Chloroflexota bacterium]